MPGRFLIYVVAGYFHSGQPEERQVQFPDTASAPSVDGVALSVQIYSREPLRAVETHQAFVCRIHLPAAGLLQPGHVLQPCLPAEGFALVRRDFSGLVTARPAGCFPAEGGFVAVPVVLAAGHYHIPVIIHESDMTPGLANKICMRTAKKICCNFPETVKLLPADKAVLTGTPIRRELLNGSRDAGFAFTGLSDDKPILLMMGGSTGSRAVNAGLRSALPQLLKEFHVIHLCGKGNLDSTLAQPGYIQYEYISDELKDLFAISDIVLSRAGANAICELLALKKPNILVPLPAAVSRGDQILNANSFKKQGFSYVLEEEKLNADTLMAAVHEVYNNRDSYKKAMATSNQSNGVDIVIKLIKELS